MTFTWKPLTIEEFVAFAGLLGPRIVRVGDLCWGEIRTCFYRPLEPLLEFHPEAVRPPLLSKVGGIQYAVPPGVEANSHLNWLIFDQTSAYSLASLDKNRRRQARLAARDFVLRPITEVGEFKQHAYPVYLSFYARTGYKVGAGRRDFAVFSEWADAVFRIPHILILGAYHQGKLGGVSISYQIHDTVIYATFFCDDQALDLYLSDLMLHTVRESAAVAPGVSRVFVGMYKGNRGLDDFYLLRGAKLVRQRARLEINPLARFLLQKFLPHQYRLLLGHMPDHQFPGESRGVAPADAKVQPGDTSPTQKQ